MYSSNTNYMCSKSVYSNFTQYLFKGIHLIVAIWFGKYLKKIQPWTEWHVLRKSKVVFRTRNFRVSSKNTFIFHRRSQKAVVVLSLENRSLVISTEVILFIDKQHIFLLKLSTFIRPFLTYISWPSVFLAISPI